MRKRQGRREPGPGAVPVELPVGQAVPGALARSRPFAALRHPYYRRLWGGALISNVGGWMQTVAQGWLVLELTDSALMLGVVGFAATLPMLLLLLIGGVFADRLDRRRLLIRMQIALMLVAATLAALTWTGTVAVWHIIALALFSGSALALAMPAYQAFVQDLVGREDLQNAIALNSAQFNLSRVVGPALAGVAVGAIGLAGCFAVNAASFVAAIAALLSIQVPSRPAPSPAPLWKSVIEGFAYVRSRPRVQALLLLTALISVLAMPYTTLLPIIARDTLGLGADGLGYLFAVGGIGAVAGALSLAIRGRFPRRGLYLLGCAAGTGAATLALGLARSPIAAGAALVAISFAATSSIALGNSLLQELVDDAMRGRVLSMFGLAFVGTFPIGNLLSGGLAHATSASTALVLTGATLLAVALIVVVRAPRLRALA
ncbi:MAG: MFS transporter [Gemmatimonadota bacterium]